MDAYEAQHLSRAIADNPALARMLRAYFVERREQRRGQLENSAGEVAVVLRGMCHELTAILNEMFKEKS